VVSCYTVATGTRQLNSWDRMAQEPPQGRSKIVFAAALSPVELGCDLRRVASVGERSSGRGATGASLLVHPAIAESYATALAGSSSGGL